MDSLFTPNYGTNMLDEVTLVADSNKKDFGDTFVGGLLNNITTGIGQTIGQQQQQQQQIGNTPIKPLATPKYTPTRPQAIQAPPVAKKTSSNTALIVISSVLVLGTVGYFAYRSNSKKSEPVNGVRGSKKKRAPKKVNL